MQFSPDYFDSIRARTRRVAVLVPPDQLEWRARDGGFSFGDLIRHLGAIERWMFAENALLHPSSYPGHGRELADGYDAVIAYMQRMHAESMQIFRSLDESRFDERTKTPGGAEIRVRHWIRSMIEHEIHHRGQIYLYLGMLDVPTPPLYGLTEEQVKERSAR